MTGSESHRQHDQQEWLAVAGFADEEEAGGAASALQNRGIPSMIDQRKMSAEFVLLVSAIELEQARGVLREADIEIVGPDHTR